MSLMNAQDEDGNRSPSFVVFSFIFGCEVQYGASVINGTDKYGSSKSQCFARLTQRNRSSFIIHTVRVIVHRSSCINFLLSTTELISQSFITTLRYSNMKNSSGTNRDIKLSKTLSWVLRHSALRLGLVISPDGYIPVEAILSTPVRNLNTYQEDDIIRVVDSNKKQRFTLCNRRIVRTSDGKKYAFTSNINGEGEDVLCIRANQGHSIPGIDFDELLTRLSSEDLSKMDVIVHGTYKKSWVDHISNEGLNRMKRNHIHFATGLPSDVNQVISGMRTSCEIYIYIDAVKCARDNVPFFRSSNGVILCPGVKNGTLACEYFSKVVDAKSGATLPLKIEEKKGQDFT